MTRFKTLAWIAAACTYLLIVLGAVVRITGSGLGCGDHWPLCNGHLFPPLDDIGTVIEWTHRLVAALVSILVVALAIVNWRRSILVVGLLALQIGLGAITVKLELSPWSVVLHLGTAMLLLATLLIIATSPTTSLPVSLSTSSSPPFPLSIRRGGTIALLSLAFATVLFGALTANLGAASACGGFPLCNGQVWITAGPLALIHWTHRLLAYALAIVALVSTIRARSRASFVVLALLAMQVSIGAATVLLGLPRGLQVAHVAAGTAVWAAVVLLKTATHRPALQAPIATASPAE